MPQCKAWTQETDFRKGLPHPQPFLLSLGPPRLYHAASLCPHPLQSPPFLAFSHLVALQVPFCPEHTSSSWPDLTI